MNGTESISEGIFQAIDIITSMRLSDLQYDKTLICTIEDTSNAESGEYVVSDTTSSFKAYSDNTKYLMGTKVYVTVPNGDMNNQKIIKGKYVSEDGSSYTYVSPLNDFIDITGNVIDDVTSATLLANKGYDLLESEKTLENQSLYEKEVELWRQTGLNITSFDRMGMSVKFLSKLKGLKTKGGTYGVRLDVNVATSTTGNIPTAEKKYSFYLTSKDCFGDPYNFETYYTQEKLFDISNIINLKDDSGNTTNSITAMRLVAFQDQDFYNEEDAPLVYRQFDLVTDQLTAENYKPGVYYKKENNSYYLLRTDNFNSITAQEFYTAGDLLPDNIFVKDVYISFGYDLKNFDSDKLILGTLDGLTYSPIYSGDTNFKHLYLRWAHKQDDESIIAIDTNEEAQKVNSDIKIHWYRYRLADKVSDELAGAFWSEIMDTRVSEDSWMPIERQLKEEYAQHYYSKDVFETKMEQMRSRIASNLIWQNNDNMPLSPDDYFNYLISPDVSAQSEMIKTIVEYPSKESVINSLLTENKEFDNIVNGYFTDENGFDQAFRDYLTNLTHDGSQAAYDEFLSVYGAGPKDPLYVGEDEDSDLYDEEQLADYNKRVENKAQFQKIVDMVTNAFAEITYYYSDVLTLQNEQICANPSTVDLIRGLNIICDPVEDGGYGGVYCIYDSTNTIMNSSEASKRRVLTATYSSLVTGESTLDKASQIQWWIPITNTMIQKPEAGIEYTLTNKYETAYSKWQNYINTYGSSSAEALAQRDVVLNVLRGLVTSYPELKGHYDLNTLIMDSTGLALIRSETFTSYDETSVPGYAIITRNGTENYTDIDVGDAQQIEIEQIFRIKNYYVQSANNNTIYCKIIKNQQTFEASITLSFGTAGTNGTDATFKLEMQDMNGNPINFMPFATGASSQVKIVPKLFNFENQEMDISDKRISYSWYSGVARTTSEDSALQSKQNAYDTAKSNYDAAAKDYGALTDAEKAIGARSSSPSSASEEVTEWRRLRTIVNTYASAKTALDRAESALEAQQNGTHYYIQLPSGTGTYTPQNGQPITLTMPANAVWTGCYHAILQASMTYQVTSKYEQVFQSGTDAAGEPIPATDSKGEYVYERITKDVNLTTYLPIPVGLSSSDAHFASIPTSVVYDMSSSNPAYYKNTFQIFNKYNNSLQGLSWYYVIEEIGTGALAPNTTNKASSSQYYPTLSTLETGGVVLKPPTMFFNNGTGLGKGYTIIAKQSGNTIWSQPVLIMQNRFGSAMLNSWDGSLTIDEENGTIMTAMVGAGVKNPDNSFSGVLMGDVEAKASAAKGIGLFGYDQGEATFGFNVDGTAFLGVSGRGRINFNGDSGTITSGNYSRYNQGMKIDLNSGISNDYEGASIAMYGHNGSIQQGIEMDTTIDNIFRIYATEYSGGSDLDGESSSLSLSGAKKNLLLVGTDNYYLQTLNFDSGAQTGTKIDLKNGKITSYNFTIDAIRNGTGIRLSSGGSPYLRIVQANDGSQVDVVNITKNSFIMQSPNFKTMEYSESTQSQQIITGTNADGTPVYETVETEVITVSQEGQGMKINMNPPSPKIEAYNFTLMAERNNNPKMFIKVSSSGSCPLNISNNFKVGWDGSFRNNSFSIGADGSLNINNCFVVDKNGNLSIKSPDGDGYFKVDNSGNLDINNKFKIDKYGNVNINNRLLLFNDGAIGIGSSILNGYSRDENGKTTFKTGVPFWVDQDGNMHAEAGQIGGWYIMPNGLFSYDPKSGSKDGLALVPNGLGDDANVRIIVGSFGSTGEGETITYSSGFKVDKNGIMTAYSAQLVNANVQGTITTGKLTATGGTINSCTIGSGYIGGWTINSGSISSGGTILNSSGTITCNDLYCYKINGHSVGINTLSVCTGYTTGVIDVKDTCTGSQTITVPEGGGEFTIHGYNFGYVRKKYKLGIASMQYYGPPNSISISGS